MTQEEIKSKYDKLFPTDEIKAKAFQEIAENFYFANFGSMQKSDLETLMFSLYLDRILEEEESNSLVYNDYVLSKCFGISQSRINNLKVRKELKYPSELFDWKKSFIRILKNAVFDDGKIKIQIGDPNLMIEVKNAIEELNGFSDTSFNSKLLIMSPAVFLDLLCILCDKSLINKVKNSIVSEINKNTDGIKFITEEPISNQIMNASMDLAKNMLASVLGSVIPVVGEDIGNSIGDLLELIKNAKDIKKTKKKYLEHK